MISAKDLLPPSAVGLTAPALAPWLTRLRALLVRGRLAPSSLRGALRLCCLLLFCLCLLAACLLLFVAGSLRAHLHRLSPVTCVHLCMPVPAGPLRCATLRAMLRAACCVLRRPYDDVAVITL
jgi:hypothetical protein